MNEDSVVIVRTKSGEELIALFVNTIDNLEQLNLENPHFIRPDPRTGNVTITPYCIFSPEKFFTMKKDEVQFVVTARPEVARRFLVLIKENESSTLFEPAENSPQEDTCDPAINLLRSFLLNSNTTKH